MEDGTTYLDEQLIIDFQISSGYQTSHQMEEIKRRIARLEFSKKFGQI